MMSDGVMYEQKVTNILKVMLFLLLTVFFVSGVFAKKRKGSRSPAKFKQSTRSIGGVDPSAPIQVHGQTRNLNMLLKLHSEREQIDFIKLRKDYEKEIKMQNY